MCQHRGGSWKVHWSASWRVSSQQTTRGAIRVPILGRGKALQFSPTHSAVEYLITFELLALFVFADDFVWSALAFFDLFAFKA